MKTFKLLTAAILLAASLFFSLPAFAEEESSGLWHRTIIYLQTEKYSLKQKDIKKYLAEFTRVEALPEKIDKPYFKAEILKDFKESFPPPDIETLSYFGKGLDRQQAEEVQKSKLALILDFIYPHDYMVKGLKASDRFAYEIAGKSKGYLWDSETRQLFTPKVWKEERLDAWFKDIPIIESHTVIHAYKNTDFIRAITLGMAKFGLPDIVVNDFSWSMNRSMGNLINVVGQSLAEGVRPGKGGKLEIDIHKLADTEFKKTMVNSLEENASSKVVIKMAEAKWEEGDPENLLLELKFDDAEGKSLQEKQESFLGSIFGWDDSIVYVRHNRLIEEASERARAKLPELKRDFNKGLDPGEYIMLKAPFKTPDGSREWMWVEVLMWKGNTIKAMLRNEPYNIPDLKAGSEVTVYEEDIFDYIRKYADGRREGNETGELIEKFQEEKES